MEYIRCDRWGELADYSLSRKNSVLEIPKESCVIHFNTEFADIILAELEKLYVSDPKLRFVLISSDSDCGICYQKENPVSADLIKAFYMVDTSSRGYGGIKLEPRCNLSKCNPDHKFSIKMYAYTYSTFDRVPPNVVRWYATNNDTDEVNIVGIPFGIPHWFQDKAKHLFVDKIVTSTNGRTYAAFQANTMERYQLINSLETSDSTLVRRQEVSHDQYIEDMMSCGFVLSPPGNGLDCYRTLEALYLGRIPIVNKNRIIDAYGNMPLYNRGDKSWNYLNNIHNSFTDSKIDRNYWKQCITNDRALLNG